MATTSSKKFVCPDTDITGEDTAPGNLGNPHPHKVAAVKKIPETM
jgi:hypothetical protein